MPNDDTTSDARKRGNKMGRAVIPGVAGALLGGLVGGAKGAIAGGLIGAGAAYATAPEEVRKQTRVDAARKIRFGADAVADRIDRGAADSDAILAAASATTPD